MSEPTFLTFVEKSRFPLFAIVALFICYVRLVFPALAEVVAGLGITLSTLSQASYQVSRAFRESWVLTGAFLGVLPFSFGPARVA